jgi:hypothetical protein
MGTPITGLIEKQGCIIKKITNACAKPGMVSASAEVSRVFEAEGSEWGFRLDFQVWLPGKLRSFCKEKLLLPPPLVLQIQECVLMTAMEGWGPWYHSHCHDGLLGPQSVSAVLKTLKRSRQSKRGRKITSSSLTPSKVHVSVLISANLFLSLNRRVSRSTHIPPDDISLSGFVNQAVFASYTNTENAYHETTALLKCHKNQAGMISRSSTMLLNKSNCHWLNSCCAWPTIFSRFTSFFSYVTKSSFSHYVANIKTK